MTSVPEDRREQVLAALVVAGAAGVSGQVIADELGCSRAAVHRHVETLRRSGVSVDGVHEGYRLAPGSDPVVPRLVTPRLTGPIQGPVSWAFETGSTNDDAVTLARSGASEGLVVGADLQNAGRGRRGRAWRTEPGDALLFSIILRPQVSSAEVGLLPILAATSVASSLGPDAGIIWPNDIVVGDRKVCGILCELAADEAGVAWVVVGIGVNVRGAPADTTGRWTPGSLADSGPPPARADLLVLILNSLGAAYADWRKNGAATVVGDYAARDRLAGTGITLEAGSRTVSGTAQGIDDAGALRVVTAFGEEAMSAGEVTRVERG